MVTTDVESLNKNDAINDRKSETYLQCHRKMIYEERKIAFIDPTYREHFWYALSKVEGQLKRDSVENGVDITKT